MLPSHSWYGVLPGALIFYALIAAAAVLFLRRVVYLLRLLRKGQALPRWDQVPARVGRVIVYVFGIASLRPAAMSEASSGTSVSSGLRR